MMFEETNEKTRQITNHTVMNQYGTGTRLKKSVGLLERKVKNITLKSKYIFHSLMFYCLLFCLLNKTKIINELFQLTKVTHGAPGSLNESVA